MKKSKIAIVGAMVFSMFAMSNMNIVKAEDKSVSMNLTAQATPIDITAPTKIAVNNAANSTALVFSTMTISNNSNVGVIKTANISVKAASGWTKVAATTDFSKMAFNSKQFSVSYNGADLMTDYKGSIEIDPKSTKDIVITGLTCGSSAPIQDMKIADVVVTVAYK